VFVWLLFMKNDMTCYLVLIVQQKSYTVALKFIIKNTSYWDATLMSRILLVYHDPCLFLFILSLAIWNLYSLWKYIAWISSAKHIWKQVIDQIYDIFPHKHTVSCSPVVAFSVVILIYGYTWRCCDCRSKI
jgi:hypothetical protein